MKYINNIRNVNNTGNGQNCGVCDEGYNVHYEECSTYDEDYDAAVRFLDALPQYMSGFGVGRSAKMLDLLGHPERGYKIVHVAGTNGKGSVCLYVHDILSGNGYRTGLFTSPHLTDIRERIRIDGQQVDRDEFAGAFAKVRKLDVDAGDGNFAYFDYMLGIAVLVFAAHGVDFAVMETGLGGRLDATNALESRVITAITTISLEHTAVLGDTVEAIAEEKAGIIQPDSTLVYLDGCNPAADEVIRRVAEKCGAGTAFVQKDSIKTYKNDGNHIDFSVSNGYYSNACFRINTGAMYQLDNCLRALTIVGAMQRLGFVDIAEEGIARALMGAHWQGRMDRLTEDIYVDGAHNPEGISSLVQSVPYIAKEREAVLLFSVVNDKNIGEMARILAKSGVFSKIVITSTGGSRKLDTDIIKEAFAQNGVSDCEVHEKLKDAFEASLTEAREVSGVLFVAGSLYLVGDVERLLRYAKEV